MGDRTNPIKFGPEWLRNLSSEPSTPGAHAGAGREGAGAALPVAGGPATPNRPANPNTNTPNTSKVLLAKLRYGREEMLALYDRQTAEAPAQLKAIDTLYQPRGKPPFALNIPFEDTDNRDNMSRQPPPGGLAPSDRYSGAGRGRGTLALDSRARSLVLPDNRGRSRGYTRQTSVGRGWHGNQRNTYSGMPDDDPNQPIRSWSSTNQPSSGLRPMNVDQPEWQTKQQQYRNKRMTNTNWRQQQGRDEGEEWRSADAGRRPQEKWEWGWQESSGRPNQDKQWHSNRRTWAGGENSEDPLPEWAVENAEACGGTFDSSGAFHGYSNDDSNLPKNQESSYPLTRSHTHGSFVRSKTVEEGSEEWWASEKAKKLSPKRFDASEIQFKKPPGSGNVDEKSNTNSASGALAGANNGHSTGAIPKHSYQSSGGGGDKASKDYKSGKKSGCKDNENDSPENKTPVPAAVEPEVNKQKNVGEAKEKTLETRSDKNEKPKDDKGNTIKSVILPTNDNSLRQKQQNIVVTPTDSPKRQPQLRQYADASQGRQLENNDSQKEKDNNKLVEDILQMNLDDGIPSATINQLLTNHNSTTMNSLAQLPNSLPMKMTSSLQSLGLNAQNKQSMPSPSIKTSGVQSSMMQPIGITNSMLNASLGLPMPNPNSSLSLQGMPQPLPNPGLPNSNNLASGLQGMGGGNIQPGGMQSASMQGLPMPSLQANLQPGANLQSNMQPGGIHSSVMQSGGPGLPGFQSANTGIAPIGNSSLFNNMPHNDINNHGGQNALHRLQQLSTPSFNNLMYGNMMSQPPPPPIPNMGMQHMSSDQWYYEDPNKTIQGPFSSKEMFNWYRAGFFSPTLMVRRECEVVMRPLGTYGHMPFGQMDLLPPFPMGGGFDLRPQQSHDNMMNQQPGLGIDVPTSNGHPLRQPPYNQSSNVKYDSTPLETQVGVQSVGSTRPELPPVPQPLPMPPFHLVQNNEVESLWGQPGNNAPGPDLLWMQAMNNNSLNENRINNLPMYFWDNQASDMSANPLLPEAMKTEDEILAQMRAEQARPPTPPLSFLTEPPRPPMPPLPADDAFSAAAASLDMGHLHKLMQNETNPPDDSDHEQKQKSDTAAKAEQSAAALKPQSKAVDVKHTKDVTKVDNGKPVKPKDIPTKTKSKSKGKDDKKEEPEIKTKEEDVKPKIRSAESSPSSKNKKEDKSNKKDLEKEKKEWIKEGFTIVKGADKSKDSKKKAEEKVAEETERKRKEEEKTLADERKRQLETIKKQQEAQSQQQQQSGTQRASVESVSKKAPWSVAQPAQAGSRDGPTLAEIQRLEREKKLEQMKEQQQMMQIIAQQQQAAIAREQEMQSGLGWAKKQNNNTPNQTLAEIQAEARKQAAAAAAAAAAVTRDEVESTPPPVNIVPWGSGTHNGGAGFWDCPPAPAETSKPAGKAVEPPRPTDHKQRKKATAMAAPKLDTSPSAEFDLWCTNMLVSWRDTSIDIPTFVSFLKDIESPYEVKDYVKCYLGESREACEFARQFLERRSRLLRQGTVTPPDDLCSPAVAVNPRTVSGSDYTELKNKGKKTKKNKMLKVDARNILGFSVTASEDRINVGDIDSV